MIYIATAGWSIPASSQSGYPGAGTQLERYARQLSGTEINSTFYRAHKPATFSKWAASVPETFRFSVKLPREITHEQRLIDVAALLEIFLLHATCLGPKLRCLLVQVPPTLSFDRGIASSFFCAIRELYDGPVAFEPRHVSWFRDEATQLMVDQKVSRVGADPALIPAAAIPSGYPDFVYLRLHGSPRIYYSAYDDSALAATAAVLSSVAARNVDAWCVFDNTASGAAATDALRVKRLMSPATFGIQHSF